MTGLWIVTWDGPHAGQRATQSWAEKANAEAHYARKLAAGLNPEIEGTEDVEEALAARTLENQP